MGSERGDDHEDLIAIVACGEPEGAGPPADFLPAEAPVEVLQADSAAGGEMQLFQAHLIPGDPAHFMHKGTTDTPPSYSGSGLDVVKSAPVGYQLEPVASDVEPACKFPVHGCREEPTGVGGKQADDAIEGRSYGGDIDRGKGEAGRTARVSDLDPAIGEGLSELGSDAARRGELLKGEEVGSHSEILAPTSDTLVRAVSASIRRLAKRGIPFSPADVWCALAVKDVLLQHIAG